MIKLTVNPGKEPATHIYLKKIVVIGSGATIGTDLIIADESLAPVHLKIMEEEGRFVVLNVANDPFATLNGFPFGKKRLNNSDIIRIGQTSILFEGKLLSNQDTQQNLEEISIPIQKVHQGNLLDTKNGLNEILEKALEAKKKQFSVDRYAKKDFGEKLHEEDNQDYLEDIESKVEQLESFHDEKSKKESSFDLDALIEEAEDLDINFESEIETKQDIFAENESINFSNPPSVGKKAHDENSLLNEEEKKEEEPTTNLLIEPKSRSKSSLKEYYLGEFDDESENWNNERQKVDVNSKAAWMANWKLWLAILIIFFIISALITAAFYISMSDKSEDEELVAAEGIADVAMALKYAQIKHIKPLTQNWSDPEFIKNNLAAVVTHDYPSLANIDSHGQFINTPYLLRIYTSGDFSHFLVIAQPAPSLLQWLIPKNSIVIDSNVMEMRKLTNLKALNRLLVNSNTLDGANAIEISELVKKGELIPLSSLAHKKNDLEFLPPKALILIRPGGENLIYNAPRYYQLGETLMAKAISLMEAPGNGHDVSRLKQELGVMSKMPNMVLYSSQGIPFAMQAQKALSAFVPETKFLTGCLMFNTKGILKSCHLVLNEDKEQVAIADGAPQKTIQEEFLTKEQTLLPDSSNSIDQNHPLMHQLTALLEDRKFALKEATDEIIQLLEENFQNMVLNFNSKIVELIKKYEKVNREQHERISNTIQKLSQEHHEMPPSLFMAYVKEAGLENYEETNQKKHHKMLGNNRPYSDEIERLIKQINSSKDLEELDSRIATANALLTLGNVPDPAQVILYQNEVHSQAMKKLHQLMSSPQNQHGSFKEENRHVLNHILNSSWIANEDEMNFYMNQFDHLIKKGRMD